MAVDLKLIKPKNLIAEVHIRLFDTGEVEANYPVIAPQTLWMLEICKQMLLNPAARQQVNAPSGGH